ncbi:hypothetical protein V5799_011035 [Amblyomma americanum]|uniref:DNA 5'-3' helicase n=1 Tax=Amblyomma americanum TaxID=6943 RepID=A0AAQ4EI02_AMBAM
MVIIKVLQGLRNRRNCLIESPTGSGKTLALLCSCLAWQQKKKEIYQAQLEKLRQEMRAREQEADDCCHYDPRRAATALGSPTCKGIKARTGVGIPTSPGPSSPALGRVHQHITAASQPEAAALANKLSAQVKNVSAAGSPSGVVPSSDTNQLSSQALSSSSDQPGVVSDQISVAANQPPPSASPMPVLPAALACHLPAALGGLLQSPPVPGAKYIVVQNNAGQALDLNTLLSLPELKTSKQTVIIQAHRTTPAKQEAIGEPKMPQPPKTPVQLAMDDDDDDFKPAKKMRPSSRSPMQARVVSTAAQPNLEPALKSSAASVSAAIDQLCQQQQHPCPTQPTTPSKGPPGIADMPMEKVPTIYYGTRTHKQIAQVVRELKKTDYRYARMAILSSRERTCIHPRVSKSSTKNEMCKELMEQMNRVHLSNPAMLLVQDSPQSGGCGFYINMKRAPPYPTAARGCMEPYDLEELVNVGKRHKVCPYYWSMDLAQSADIIFCPYNYLIDPVIRKCLSIDLTDAVVVLDEAHNIEDISREVMSFTVTQDQLHDIIKDVEEMLRYPILPTEHTAVARVMSKLSLWITQHSDLLTDYRSFEQSGKVWAGTEILAFMTDVGLSPDKFRDFKNTVTVITAVEKDPELARPMVNAATSAALQNLVIILDFMYKDNQKYLGDFRAAMVKSPSKKKQTELSSWQSGGAFNIPWTHSLSFWCLNPAVAMSDLKDRVHSLIVASGTLTPMESFESELDMPFKSQLQANHVIPREGVWIGGIGYGPNKVNLTANFRTAETFEFQDEIGSILWDICKAVPHGVLCFFPSYGMMNKLAQRWQLTGMWYKLESLKHIAMEPQKADGKSFEHTMDGYYNYASGESSNDCDDRGGALLLAVCRGKVSEGLDFADNSARAVVTIGIPFPNVKDMQVDLKRKYNDQQCRLGRPVMGGNAWYETQAFRALNQALGRCIRHSEDWGALIIIDHRFSQQPKFQKGTSLNELKMTFLSGLFLEWSEKTPPATVLHVDLLCTMPPSTVHSSGNSNDVLPFLKRPSCGVYGAPSAAAVRPFAVAN